MSASGTRRVRDRYVRPPIVAHEPAPRWVAKWRFRIISLLIGATLTVVTALVVLHFVNTEQNPSFGGWAGPAAAGPQITR
jgi:hypothetical protein